MEIEIQPTHKFENFYLNLIFTYTVQQLQNYGSRMNELHL